MTSRADLPEKIRSLLVSPANVAVHGSPGSGKSWVGDQVVRLLQLDNERVVRVDVSTQTSGRGVFEELLHGLGEENDVSAMPCTSTREAWRGLRSALESSESHVVLYLDQLDRVVQFGDALDFLPLLRDLVHRPAEIRCTALIASRRSLQSIETLVSGISTLAGVCYTEYLGSLEVHELAGLAPGVVTLTADEEIECLRWSGGHPVLARYWLTTRPDRRPDPASELQRARIAMRVVDHLSDLGLIDAAAQYILGPVMDDFLTERQELELLGILPLDGRDDSSVASLSIQGHFRDALRHRTWNMNPWGILGQAEVRLRGVVDSVLIESYGREWAVHVEKKNPNVKTALAKAQVKRDHDVKMFSRNAHLLSYTYPRDLWDIISAEWIYFQSVFRSHDKAHWRTVMIGLSEYRAPLAHGRPEVLGEAQRSQCRLFAEKILSEIARYEDERRGASTS